MNDKILGERIKARRERLDALYGNFDQEDVASQLGLTRAGYAHWEQGRRGVSATDLNKLAKILQVHLSYFFEEDAEPILLDEPSEDEEGEVLSYFRKIPPLMRPQAKAVLRAFIDQQPDYEEGRIFGKKAE